MQTPLPDSTLVWRYMSFGKLVWMLQKKALWLTPVEMLDDKWEVTLHGPQLNTILAKAPIAQVDRPSGESASERASRIVKALRKSTYVSCWSASHHESHALWRIYCPTCEGVAIQTTLGRLRASVAPLPIVQVDYGNHGEDGRTPDVTRLVAQKRPMFDYEREVRVVHFDDSEMPNGQISLGAGLKWDPAKHLEQVWVHPEAPFWFMEAVTEIVRQLAPELSQQGHPMVPWSRMSSPPPV